MIQSGLASFVVSSTETTPDAITAVLGIEPNHVVLKGTVLRSGRVQPHNVWSIDSGRMDNAADDQTGTVALRWLLERCRAAAGRASYLPDDCETRIWWTADSDSIQGGFVLPADLLVQLAALGVDMCTSVNLEDPCEDDQRPQGRDAPTPKATTT